MNSPRGAGSLVKNTLLLHKSLVTLSFFLIQLLNSVQYGLLLFLCAAGLTLVFGIMGVINLAHGSMYMLGAYLAFSLSEGLGSLWLALPVGVLLAFAFGALLEKLVIGRLYNRPHLHQVLLTYGLILVFDELRSLLWGDDVHGVAVPRLLEASLPLTDTLSYPVYRLSMSGACLVVALALGWVLLRTRLGMTIRAGSVNGDMVQSLASTSAGCGGWCSPRAWRWPLSPACWPRRPRRCSPAWATRCSSCASWWW